jgi:transposase
MRARLRSYLSDNGVRLKEGTRLTQGSETQAQIRQARSWSPRQWQVIEILLAELRHADQQRQHWHSLIAQEVLAEPQLLALARLCGVREIIAFALGAFIGDIKRFASPKKLVKYVGLNPAFDDSGDSQWRGGIGGHGHKVLRSLLMEGAQAILRSSKTALARWGRKLLAAKGSVNLAVAAIARKLTVAVWYLMMGRWTALEELDARLLRKLSSMISAVGQPALKALGKSRKLYREEICRRLRTGAAYVLDPNKTYTPIAAANPTKV